MPSTTPQGPAQVRATHQLTATHPTTETATLVAANVLATALLAWCAVTGAELWGRTSPIWFFMTVGVCGGFSTFSTFAWDTLRLWEDGGWALAATNVAVSVVGCVAVSWWVARTCAAP